MRIYLDNCCYNRPFDDQTQMKIHLESQAKLYVQSKIRNGVYELVWSYILDYENAQNPYEEKRLAILPWKTIAKIHVEENEDILRFSEKLVGQNIKMYDALHIACAVDAGCEYFLTTDKKLINASIQEIRTLNPIEFVEIMEDADEN